MTKHTSLHDILDALGVPGPIRSENGLCRFVAPQDLLGSSHIIDIRWCDENAATPESPAGIDIVRRYSAPQILADARQNILSSLTDYEKKVQDPSYAEKQVISQATHHSVWAMHIRPSLDSVHQDFSASETLPGLEASVPHVSNTSPSSATYRSFTVLRGSQSFPVIEVEVGFEFEAQHENENHRTFSDKKFSDKVLPEKRVLDNPSVEEAVSYVKKCIQDIGGHCENWSHAVKLEMVSHPHPKLTSFKLK